MPKKKLPPKKYPKRAKRIDRTKPLTILYLRDLDKWIKDRFKALCYRRGTNMHREIEGFMRRQVEEDMKYLGGGEE